MMFSFQFSPAMVLYAWAETKPPMKPKRMYMMIITVANAPRLLGDKNPSKAKTAVVSPKPGVCTRRRTHHHKQLRARAQQDREQQSLFRRPKHIPMNQLPSRILLHVLHHIHLIVPRDILVQCAEEDHCDHSGEEDDDDGGIDEGKPVDSGVEDVEVFIPAGGPAGCRVLASQLEKQERGVWGFTRHSTL